VELRCEEYRTYKTMVCVKWGKDPKTGRRVCLRKEPRIVRRCVRYSVPKRRLTLNDVVEMHESRSPRARALDEAKKAKIANTFEQWAEHPDRYDIRGVDYPIGREFKTEKVRSDFYPLYRVFRDKGLGWVLAEYKLEAKDNTVCISFTASPQVTKKDTGDLCFRDRYDFSMVERYVKEHFKEPLARKMITFLRRDLQPYEPEIKRFLTQREKTKVINSYIEYATSDRPWIKRRIGTVTETKGDKTNYRFYELVFKDGEIISRRHITQEEYERIRENVEFLKRAGLINYYNEKREIKEF